MYRYTFLMPLSRRWRQMPVVAPGAPPGVRMRSVLICHGAVSPVRTLRSAPVRFNQLFAPAAFCLHNNSLLRPVVYFYRKTRVPYRPVPTIRRARRISYRFYNVNN